MPTRNKRRPGEEENSFPGFCALNPQGTGKPRLMARRNAAPWGGTGANPPFSFAERKCAVDGGKETGALPGQGFGRDPSAGVTKRGAGIGNTLRYAEQFSTKAVEKATVLDDCACCLFAAAVRCEAGAFCVGFTQRLLRPPDCGSKMTAGTIVYRPERTQFYNSRGRGNRFSPGLPRAAPSLLHL